jgi:hypothetical protein
MTDSKSLGDSVFEYDSESKVRFLLYRLIIQLLDIFFNEKFVAFIPSSLIKSPALVYQPILTLEIICGLEPLYKYFKGRVR